MAKYENFKQDADAVEAKMLKDIGDLISRNAEIFSMGMPAESVATGTLTALVDMLCGVLAELLIMVDQDPDSGIKLIITRVDELSRHRMTQLRARADAGEFDMKEQAHG